jgi:hypothetical protein
VEIKGKNILIVSPEPWDHIFLSKHHYAVHLSKLGNTVFFLNRPRKENAIKTTSFENLFEVTIKHPIKGFRLWPSFFRKIYTRKLYNKIEKLCKVKFDIVWCFDHSLFFQLDALPSSLIKISHIVDYTQDYNLPIGAATANVCFTPNRFLLEKLQKYNPRSYFINHGYHIPESNLPSFQYATGRKAIRVGYAGNLEIKYLDWGLIEQLAQRHPEIDFLMAGPVSESRMKNFLDSFPNIHFVGVLDSNELQGFYQSCDILLICYKADEFPEQLANPHKMIEYLASSKMLVATWTAAFKQLYEDNLILMAKSKEEFLVQFENSKRYLEKWNSNIKAQNRKAFAINNTYSKQIDKISRIINYGSRKG